MRFSFLASRNRKEIMRDPLTILLGIVLPLFLLILFALIERSAPMEIFKAENLAPGMIVFGFSFLTMFSAILIARDKKSSFLVRLFASPMTATDYILAYSLPLLPIALLQCICCLIVAVILGVHITVNLLIVIIVLIPMAVIAISIGLLFGTLFSETQVQGIGTLYVTLAALLGGSWMDLNMIGGVIKTIGYCLPFAHAIDAAREVLSGNISDLPIHLIWVCVYAVITFLIAVASFKKRMHTEHM